MIDKIDDNNNDYDQDVENNDKDVKYYKEYWTGDSRDGSFCDGEGYHYYKMKGSFIVEAYEYYEYDDGIEVVSVLPEMKQVDWFKDIGFEDFDILDEVSESEFNSIKKILYH